MRTIAMVFFAVGVFLHGFAPFQAEAATGALNGYTFRTNGSAYISGSIMRLASAVESQAGSAFITLPFSIDDTSFNAYFQYDVFNYTRAGGDGFAFVVQNDAGGAGALGYGGSYIGYGNIRNGFAVEFDTYDSGADPNANHVAINLGGNVDGIGSQHVVFANPDIDLRGYGRHAWIDYDGYSGLIDVYVSNSPVKPGVATLSYGLGSLSGHSGPTAYIGFSAGTGAAYDYHDIKDFSISTYAATAPVPVAPEPVSSVLFLVSAATFAARKYFTRRK